MIRTRKLDQSELEALHRKTQDLAKRHIASSSNPLVKVAPYEKCDLGLECFSIPITGVNTLDYDEIYPTIKDGFPPGTKLFNEKIAGGGFRVRVEIPLRVPRDEEEEEEEEEGPRKKRYTTTTQRVNPPSMTLGLIYLSGLILSGGILAIKYSAGHFDKLFV